MKTIEERLYELEQKEKIRNEKAKEAVYKYLTNNPKKKLFHSAKNNAKNKNIEFTITEDDITIPEYCPYLGVKLTHILGSGRCESNMSIRSIDSNKGYIPGNIQIISDLANRMKQNATPEQLIVFATNILKQYT